MKKEKKDALKKYFQKREAKRIGIVLNYQKQEPKSIKNFIDTSLITGRSL